MARRLLWALRSRGVDRWTSEDITQDVARRAVEHNVPFASPTDLYPWADRVASNLVVDLGRRRALIAMQPWTAYEDPAAPVDVAREVEGRLD
ncbi:MAG TPA: hypothetical protein VM938_07270, partial [Acidimicrobiales bacterium]|nr:hypothetical protein [Acidimicrobiales bacterium]